MAVVAGVKALIVDGVRYKTAAEASYNVVTKKNESIIGGDGRLGRTETARAAFIKVKVHLEEGQSQADLLATTGREVQLECADRTVTLIDADECTENEVTSSDNSFEVQFEAVSGQEVF